ncbi:MAG TPA: hypothetical protein VHY76_02760 [Acetobacteraceae bacterium]|nr:hypothetical protein [Acetobacteraceae bacterium]
MSTTTTASGPAFTVPALYPVFLQQSTLLHGFSVQDAYASATGTPITITAGDLAGMLSLGEIAGLTLNGAGTTQLSMTGSVAAVDAGLANLQYRVPATRLPFDTLSFEGTDAEGGIDYAATQIATGAPSAPTIDGPPELAADEGMAIAVAGLSVSDPTGGDGGGAVAVTLADQSGTLAAAAAAGGAVTGSGSPTLSLVGSFAAVNQELATVTYTGAGEAADDTLAIVAVDQGGASGPVEVGVAIGGVGAVSTISTGPGSSLVPLGDGPSVVFSTGSDVIVGGAGPATVFASGNAMMVGGAGSLEFVNGGGNSTVVGGTGSATIDGGAGGGVYKGGSAGNNFIIAGQMPTTIFGAGSGDLLMAAGAGPDLLIAGAGNETLTGVGSTGDNVFYAGSGADLLGGGAGAETFIGGTGSETVLGGGGADLYAFVDGLSSGGQDQIYGFDPTKGDRVLLDGYGPNPVASATSSDGATTLVLTDSTTITFEGVPTVPGGAFA